MESYQYFFYYTDALSNSIITSTSTRRCFENTRQAYQLKIIEPIGYLLVRLLVFEQPLVLITPLYKKTYKRIQSGGTIVMEGVLLLVFGNSAGWYYYQEWYSYQFSEFRQGGTIIRSGILIRFWKLIPGGTVITGGTLISFRKFGRVVLLLGVVFLLGFGN